MDVDRHMVCDTGGERIVRTRIRVEFLCWD